MKVYELMKLLSGCNAGSEVLAPDGREVGPVSRVVVRDDGDIELTTGDDVVCDRLVDADEEKN